MTVKQQALETISRLPDDCTLEDVYVHLSSFRRVNQNLLDAMARIESVQAGMRLTTADGGQALRAARAAEMYGVGS